MSKRRQPGCWAAALGDCKGKLTGEHYLSEVLIKGPSIQLRGFHWCEEEIREIGVGAATANILCARHNSRLSHADSAAGALKQALVSSRETARGLVKGQRAMRSTRLSGAHFGQWLTKTHCNYTTLGGRKPGHDFVLGAFGLPTSKVLHFTFLYPDDRPVPVNDNHVGYLQFYSDNGESFFWCDFYGLQWVVTCFPWDSARSQWLNAQNPQVYASAQHVECLNDITFQVPGGPERGHLELRLCFDW